MTNLCSVEFGYTFPADWDYSYLENDNRNLSFRVREMTNGEKAKKWIQEFSEINKITWRVLKTFPNAGRINTFKLHMRCQHKTDKRFKGMRSTKNTDCPAELVVLVRRYVKKSKAKDVDVLIKDYPGIVTLKHKHNHLLDSAMVLKYRDLDPQIKEKFKRMFMVGHDPASAINSHKIDLMLEYKDVYHQVIVDGKYMPTHSIVSKLFDSFEKKYGSVFGETKLEVLQNYLKQYENTTGGKAEICQSQCGEHYFVVLCTPLMLRVHEKIIQSSELVLLDTSVGVGKQKHQICFLVTPTAAGALPLGLIICDSENDNVFSEALQLYKAVLGDKAFFQKKEPEVFLTGNLKEINALSNNFQNSSKLLCQFHMLKSMWAWICDPKHEIHQKHKQEAYLCFKKILYSLDEQEMEEHFRCFKSFARKNSYEMLFHYIDRLYTYKEKWVSCLRLNLPIRVENTINHAEIVFRVLKDCILNRIAAFDLSQLIDFILTRYDLYMKQRLVDFSNGKYSNSLLEKMLPDKFNRSEMKEMKIAEISEHSYTVTDKDNEVFCVEIDKGDCSCFMGKAAKLCIHASAVMLSLKENIQSAFSEACLETKHDFLYIAEGILSPSDLPLKHSMSEFDFLSEGLQFHLQANGGDVPSELEDSLSELEDVPYKLEDLPSELEDVPAEFEYVSCKFEKPYKLEDIPSESEDVSSELDVLSELEDVPSELEDAPSELEDAPSESEDVQSESEDIPSESESSKEDFLCDIAINDSQNCYFTDSSKGKENSEDKLTLSEDQKKQLQDFFNRIINGVQKKSSVFVPAVKTLLKNVNIYAKTDSGLVSALQSFGSDGRRVSSFPRKRRIGAENQRPKVQVKTYYPFGMLPPQKRKAPHILESYSFDNNSLGEIKMLRK